MPRQWTDEQLDAITVRDCSAIVSAAAGSGKTTVLVERVLRLLTDEEKPVSPKQLVIVTFTNAAANEMRQRLQNGLTGLLDADADNAFLQQQQMLLQSANICTIHSFCFDLIKSNFHLLDISAGFRIADDTELTVLKRQAMEQVLEEYYAEKSDIIAPLADFFWDRNDRRIEEHITALYDFTRSVPFANAWLARQLSVYAQPLPLGSSIWAQDIFTQAAAILSYAESITQEALDMVSGLDKAERTADALQADLLLIRSAQSLVTSNDWDTLFAFLQGVKFGAFATAKLPLSDDERERLTTMRKRVKTLVKDELSKLIFCTEQTYLEDLQALTPIISYLLALTSSYTEQLKALKQERNVIDFSDAEQYAVQLLAKQEGDSFAQTDLAKELSCYYEHIVIDEFQDVNNLQDLIFSMLSRSGENIFVVGDVKQSIYRFRQANPDIFIRKRDGAAPYIREDFSGSHARITLTRNFRSRIEVTDTVNYLFESIMSRQAGEIEYDADERLVAAAEYPHAADRQTEVLILDKSATAEAEESNEPSAIVDEDKSSQEAAMVAARIRRLLDEGFLVSDGKGGLRPCRCRDFCILLRSTKGKAEMYLNELKKLDVRAMSGDAKGYFASREISVMLNLLRVIDNPLRDVPLVSVMLSPVYMFTADELAQIRIGSKGTPIYVAVLRAAEGGDALATHCAALLQSLRQLREYAASFSIQRLIRKIYGSTDFLAVVQVLDSGEQKRANLRLLLEYAAKFEQTGSSGLSAFLRYIERVLEQNADFEQANIISEAEDCVRIMTIHKSKGLEFPICIVADCGKHFNLMDLGSDLLLHADKGIGMKMREPERLKKYSTIPYEAIKLIKRKNTISEEMRLLYVAMTRAKEKLILSLSVKDLAASLKKLSLSCNAKGIIAPYAALSAASYADWMLMCLLRHEGGAQLRELAGVRDCIPVRTECGIAVVLGVDNDNVQADTDLQKEPQTQGNRFTAQPDSAMMNALEAALSFRYPHAPLCAMPAKLTVTELVKAEHDSAGNPKSRLLKRPKFMAQQGLTGAQRGDALHKFMQYADYACAAENPAAEVQRLCAQEYLTKQQGDVVNLQKVARFFASTVGKRIFASVRVYREYKFLSQIPATEYDANAPEGFEATPIFIQGIADCIFEEEDGLVLLDYKTDFAASPEELTARYGRQLLLYKAALEKIFGKPVKECILYSFGLEAAIAI